jgi:hypothetical protein
MYSHSYHNDDVSVLRDTGCSTVFVHSKFTNTDHLTGHTRDICLANGTVKQCPEVYSVFCKSISCFLSQILNS